jgi:hypothetical protein
MIKNVYVIYRGWRNDPEREHAISSIWDDEALAKKELKSLFSADPRFHHYMVAWHLNYSKVAVTRALAGGKL